MKSRVLTYLEEVKNRLLHCLRSVWLFLFGCALLGMFIDLAEIRYLSVALPSRLGMRTSTCNVTC